MSLKVEDVMEMAAELKCLPYFPGEAAVLVAVTRLIGLMCEDMQQARWLINRMTSGIYSQWPGVAEMRACYCASKKPKDGIEVYSTVFVDGVPPEPGGFAERVQISTPALKALPGDVVSDAPSVNEFVADLAKMKRVESGYARRPDDLPVNRVTTVNRITEEDIERAVAELHEKRKADIAAQELAATPSEPERPEVNL